MLSMDKLTILNLNIRSYNNQSTDLRVRVINRQTRNKQTNKQDWYVQAAVTKLTHLRTKYTNINTYSLHQHWHSLASRRICGNFARQRLVELLSTSRVNLVNESGTINSS